MSRGRRPLAWSWVTQTPRSTPCAQLPGPSVSTPWFGPIPARLQRSATRGSSRSSSGCAAEAHAVWQPHVELLIGQHAESIDLVLLGSQEIWATEIERMATDFQAQYRRADRKRERWAPFIGGPFGW